MLTFLYRLALALGIWDVERLAEEMSVDQLYGWLAYYHLEPWGDEYLRWARTQAMLRNAHFKGPKAKPYDYMPVAKREQTPEQMWQVLNSIPLPQ